MAEMALSIRQPWAWLIANGWKDIENRSWPTRFRGRFLIYASKRFDGDAWNDLINRRHPVTGERIDDDLHAAIYRHGVTFHTGLGGIVGEAEIVDCVTKSQSPWYVGLYGFVIRNAQPLPFAPCRSRPGFFRPDLSSYAIENPPIKRDLFKVPGAQLTEREKS